MALAVLGWLFVAPPSSAAEPPAELPRYDLAITLDPPAHRAEIRERVTWTNPTSRPVEDLAFNFYPHYQIPDSDRFLIAKAFELMRLQPSLGLDRDGKY